MRECIRCGEQMKEGCAIRVEGSATGKKMITKEKALFSGRIVILRLLFAQSAEKFLFT